MKRFWLGLILLLGLPVLGFGSWAYMDSVHQPISTRLEAAAEEAMTGDWQRAVDLARDARDRWDASRSMTAALCSHNTLEEIDRFFARLEAHARTRDRDDFAAVCMELAQLTRTPSEGQYFSWWNLL